jgi:serine/threonine-protein kinase
MPAPRLLLGSEGAPVRITEFTDVLCSHCADLQKTLDALREHLPEGSFSIEPRQFPLDGTCNALVPARGAPLRCLAAKARICLEGHPGAEAFAAALFENQETLDADRVFTLAGPYMARRPLEACIASASTRSKLEDDIRFASQYDPDGTPLVLVNGRKGTSFGPFLFAMVVSGGEASPPAFDGLPPPDPNAHVH